MNKMKKMIMSFAAVALIVGGSAFTSAVKSNSAKFVTTYYALNDDGETYRKIGSSNPTSLCEENEDFPACTISYPDDNHANTLPADNLPDSPTEVGSNGWVPQ